MSFYTTLSGLPYNRVPLNVEGVGGFLGHSNPHNLLRGIWSLNRSWIAARSAWLNTSPSSWNTPPCLSYERMSMCSFIPCARSSAGVSPCCINVNTDFAETFSCGLLSGEFMISVMCSFCDIVQSSWTDAANRI